MLATDVIKKPILTEKTTYAMNEEGKYTFLVDRRANKDDIRDAFQQIYGIRPVKVVTQTRKGRTRRMKFGWVGAKVTKKAIVRLPEGKTIELF